LILGCWGGGVGCGSRGGDHGSLNEVLDGCFLSLDSLLDGLLSVELGDHFGDVSVFLGSLELSDLDSAGLDGQWVLHVHGLWSLGCLSDLLLGVLDLGSVEELLGLLWGLDDWLLFNLWCWLLTLGLSSDLHWEGGELSELCGWHGWVLVSDGVDLSLPVLSWVLVARPEHESVLILVLVVLEGQALLVLVADVSMVEPYFLVSLSLVLSHGDHLSLLHSLLSLLDGVRVGHSELSVGVESDGLGSLVNDEQSSPVGLAGGGLQDVVVPVLLLAHVQLSVSWHLGGDVEWSLPKLTLGVLEWDLEDLLPLLNWVLVAVPPGQSVHVLGLEGGWGQALSLVVGDVNDSLLGCGLEVEVLLVNLSFPLSEGGDLANVESVRSILVGQSKVSEGVKSDGLGSGIEDEPCSPVVSLSLELDDSILSTDHLADSQSEVSLSLGLEHESLSVLGFLLLVLVHVLWELVVSLGVNSLLDSWSIILSLESSWLDDDSLELLGLGLIKWLPLDWGKGSEVLEGEVELGSSELGVESSIVSEGLAWLVFPQFTNDVVSGESD